MKNRSKCRESQQEKESLKSLKKFKSWDKITAPLQWKTIVDVLLNLKFNAFQPHSKGITKKRHAYQNSNPVTFENDVFFFDEKG